jgi:hypothetical protein
MGLSPLFPRWPGILSSSLAPSSGAKKIHFTEKQCRAIAVHQ